MSNKLTAFQARKLVESVVPTLDSIYEEIEKQSLLRRNCINIQSIKLGKTEEIIDLSIETLKEDGYKVERNRGYDPRDSQDSWDYVIISW